MDEVEYFAKISMLASQIGGVQELSCGDLQKLMELRKKMQIPGRHPGCQKCENRGTDKCVCKANAVDAKCACGGHAAPTGDDALVAEITKKVLAALGK